MQLEGVSCPNCGSEASSPWAREGGFTMVRCATCRLLYVNPRPADDEISEANKVGEHKTESGQLNVVARWAAWKPKVYAEIVSAMFPEGVESWLDIGAGYGEVVMAVDRAFPGVSVRGIEPMAPKVVEAKRRGLPVESVPLEELGEQFDVVSLINVFSHIPDFTGYFGQLVASKVRPGGVLFIETGNVADLESRREFPDRLYLPDHLVFGGVSQVSAMVERLGFDIEAIQMRRTDDALNSLKATVKAVMRREPTLHLPYTSKLRSMFLKCRKRSAPC